MHLTSYRREKPPTPPAFCMALRKHLRNGRITDIRQHNFDRVVALHVDGREGRYQLVCEFFGDGNIILVDEEGRILQALRYRRMSHRNILIGEAFRYPPPPKADVLTLTMEDLEGLREYGSLEVVRGLSRLLGIGGLYAEEILLRAKVDKGKACGELTEEELRSIHLQIGGIASAVRSGSLEPHVVVEDGRWIDVLPVRLLKYAHLESVTFRSFNEAVDEYFTRMEASEASMERVRRMEAELNRRRRILEEQRKALDRLRVDAEKARNAGDTVYAHLGELNQLLHRVRELRSSGVSWSEIPSQLGEMRTIRVHSIHPETGLIEVEVDGSTITLDVRASAQETASKYYERAKKLERKIKGLLKAMEESEKALKELEVSVVEAPPKMPEKIRRRKAPWYERFRWFRTSDGFLVVAGRDAHTNELLVRRYMKPGDLVLHADIVGAPVAIVKADGGTPTEQALMEAAQFAASHSRAWKLGLEALDVYWVKPEQVGLAAPPGQYLRRGSFAVKGRRNYIRGVPLRLAVGVVEEDGELKVFGGPVDAVKSAASVYVVIGPGDKPGRVLAEEIRIKLADEAPNDVKGRILKIPLEDIRRLIPYGVGRVVPSQV